MEKLKVVWICHFSNVKVREKLPLSKMRISNFLRTIFGKTKFEYGDFAPWISALINEFEKLDNIELHIIAPHYGLKKSIYEFEINHIFYHFFRSEDDYLCKKIINRVFKKDKKYKINKKIVKELVNKINPDIINLIGTENPYYSITVLDILNKPIVASMQTVYSNTDRLKLFGKYDLYRSKIEQNIFEKVPYYFVYDEKYKELIQNYKPSAIILKVGLPIEIPVMIEKKVYKLFDFIFFAFNVTNEKGIFDSIEAIALVKKIYPNVRFAIVGMCSKKVKKFLNDKINEYGLYNNIVFHDYFPDHEKLYQYLQQSRFALLPIKIDLISSTIREAMYLELPVVTYKTEGTPYLNKEKECVLLSEIGDIQGLANNMIKLLNSNELADKLKNNAKEYYLSHYDNNVLIKQMVNSYGAIINHYYYNIPIPKELLY